MRYLKLVPALMAAVWFGAGAFAQSFPIQGVAAMEILSGYRTQSGTHMAAARIRLKEGWKTYWRAPGGNGIPPRFSWDGSKNVVGVAYHWPAPTVYVKDGVRTIGYENELVLPIEFQPGDKNADITVKGTVDFGVCEDVCIPARASFRATLSKTGNAHVNTISQALKGRPKSAKKGGVKTAKCAIKPIKDGFSIVSRIETRTSQPAASIVVVEFASPDVWVDSRHTEVRGNILTTSAELLPLSKEPFVFDRSKLRLTILGAGKAIEVRGCAA